MKATIGKHILPLCILVAVGLASRLGAQNRWQYHNIVTDVQQSGQFPNLAADASGTLHATYWNELEDKLMYAQRNPITGVWSYELIAPDAGIRAALKIDSQLRPRVAFFANQAGKLKLMYAVRTAPGTWNIEAVGDSTWGNYGLSWQFSNTRPQPSLDLLILPNGNPRIVFFDATFEGCFLGANIGYEMQWAVRQAPGLWTVNSFGNFPNLPLNLGWESCESTYAGERYGEFCKVELDPDGYPQIYAFVKTSGVFKRWFATQQDPEAYHFGFDTLDNNERILFLETDSPDPKWYPKCSFEGLSFTRTPDSVLHFVYTTSDGYGRNDQNRMSQLIGTSATYVNNHCHSLTYLRVRPDGSRDTLQILDNSFYPYTSFIYRTFTAITHKGSDTLYFSVANLTDARYTLYYSFNGGESWQTNTIYASSGAVGRMAAPLVVMGNTLHTLVFDHNTNALLHGTRSVDMTGTWAFTSLTRTEWRGASVAACTDPQNPDDIHLAYADWVNKLLVYGKRTGGNWDWDTVNSTPSRAHSLQLVVHPSSGQPTLVFSGQLTNRVAAATRNMGVWTTITLDATTPGDYFSLVSSPTGDTLHLCYYDPANRLLKYTRRLNGSWTGILESIDGDVDDRVGEHASLAVDRAGVPHIAYLRTYITGTLQDSLALRLARRLAQNQWQRSDIHKDSLWMVIGGVNLRFGSDNQPRVAFYRFDALTDSVFTFAWRDALGAWHHTSMQSLFQGAESMPLTFVLDSLDRPWMAFSMQTIPDDLQMASLGVAAPNQYAWFPVDNNLNNGQIALEYALLQDGTRFRIVGRKNKPGNRGLGILEMPDWTIWTQTVGTTPAVAQPAGLQVLAYPNPSQQVAFIRTHSLTLEPLTLTVTDLQGRTVFTATQLPETQNATFTLPVADWVPGVYTYTVRGESGVATGKLVRVP